MDGKHNKLTSKSSHTLDVTHLDANSLLMSSTLNTNTDP